MMNALKYHIESHKDENRMLIEANKKFCYQIIHELLSDEEFAKTTLPNIQQNMIPYLDVRNVIGVMKDCYLTTNRVPSADMLKTLLLEKFSNEYDSEMFVALVDHCSRLDLAGTRKEEVHLHWNTIYCMFHYVKLLNGLYELARDSQGNFLSQYKLVKNMADKVEKWRKDFYGDECVKEVLGKTIKDERFEDWDDVSSDGYGLTVCGGTDLKSVGGTDSESDK